MNFLTKTDGKNLLKEFYNTIKPLLNHSNRETLDKITESEDNQLLFNGTEIKGEGIELAEGNAFVIDSTPVGTVISYMGINIPKDYLTCDGTEYSINQYKELSDFILAEFGTVNYFGGDGTTTFAVPDLRGEFLRGTGTATRDTGSGSNIGEHQDGTEFPNLTGGGSFGIASLTSDDVYNTSIKNRDKESSDIVQNKYANVTQSSSLYPRTYTSRPTNTSVNYCIKYKMSTNSVGELEIKNYTNIDTCYSAEEKVVGCWTNGKPLYQKTIDCKALPNATSKSILINIDNIEFIYNIFGISYIDSTNIIPLPYAHPSSSILLDYRNKNIFISSRTNFSSYKNTYVTIQYTKTTDTENSYEHQKTDLTENIISEEEMNTAIDEDLNWEVEEDAI